MFKSIRILVCMIAIHATMSARADDATIASPLAANSSALKVMDAFMAAFNARDTEAWAGTLLYPHVRFASGKVTIFPDRAAFIAANGINALIAGEGWHHSGWDSLEVVQSSADKVHIAVSFTRYRADGEKYASYPSLYIVERGDEPLGRARTFELCALVDRGSTELRNGLVRR